MINHSSEQLPIKKWQMDIEEDEEDNISPVEQIFHNTIREHIIFFLLFLLLYLGSYMLIGRFRKRDREDIFSTDADEILIYRISLWLCTFSLAVTIGAALLVPISIASNEVLLLYPKSFYVKWLNTSLIQGLWNYVFLFSNLSLFVFLPFSYLFFESSGFVGYKSGVISRAYETFTVFSLLAAIVFGMTYVISALIDPEKNEFKTLLWNYHLPFLYSCVSFLGVLLLIVCTPLGFVRLFGVVGQIIVKPLLLRDINEEFNSYNMEKAFLKRKLSFARNNQADERNGKYSPLNTSKLCDIIVDVKHVDYSIEYHKLEKRLKDLDIKKQELDKLRSSTGFQRNIVYPLAMLVLLFLTGITVLIVMQNTLELLIGIKAFPLSTRKLTLGITSLSKLGPIGAAIEVLIILYLEATSAVGLYTMPFMRLVRPLRKATSLPQLIVNCALLLILSSAQPLLSRIIGITNFDLLGDFGSIEWLGNFQIVLMYNLIFGVATTCCVVNKFTATVRRELVARLSSLFRHSLSTFFIIQRHDFNDITTDDYKRK